MPSIVEQFTDATGQVRRAPAETVAWIRARVTSEPDALGPIVIATGDRWRFGPGRLHLEAGGQLDIQNEPVDELPLGYHRFESEGSVRLVAITPRRGLLPAQREWGWATQLYATRSRDSHGIGDLGDLTRLARWAKDDCGAGLLLVNPLNAAAPGPSQQPSPYSPTSRRFLNPIYADLRALLSDPAVSEAVPGAAEAAASLNSSRIIDRDRIVSVKMQVLEAAFDARATPSPGSADERLTEFATWTVLAEHHGPDWRTWPAEFRRPDAAGVREFGQRHRRRVEFHCWVQTLLREQLHQVSSHLRVVQDLPIGFDVGGMDAWAWQDMLALDASVGAPADGFNTRGQDWGLPPFVPDLLRSADYRPFIETVRACLAQNGGLRIDHVMGLFRLWWIPEGASPADGAFVRYPADDLVSLLLLECARANAVAIGEDLGTVEPEARAQLADRNVLSYQLLWFEPDHPSTWRTNALAAVSTHDLPTVAGLWDHSDLETQRALDLNPNVESTMEMRGRLAAQSQLADGAANDDAVRAAYTLLAQSPAHMLVATLDDALSEPQRPNIPGADGKRPNWSLALPATLDEIEDAPLAHEIAGILSRAVADESAGSEPQPTAVD